MTDLELVKACAIAMGLRVDNRWPDRPIAILPFKTNYRGRYGYDPLHDDAQAMALVKKFDLCIEQYFNQPFGYGKVYLPGCYAETPIFTDHNLNRAIVSCVAKLKSL